MIRICELTSGIMTLMVLTSCGRTVQTTGENIIVNKSQKDIPETVITSFVTESVSTEPSTEAPVTAPSPVKIDIELMMENELESSFVIDDFETVMQEPELPTGCEITALAQTMNYYGFDIDKVDLCDTFMLVDYDGYYTMNEVYLGDPHATNGFGCNAPVIVNTANDYFEYIGSDWYAIDITGISLDEIFYYIAQDIPVIAWTTIDQRETIAEYQFVLGCGEDFWFNPFQHCVTIYGYDYDRGIVNIADPLVGNTEYDMERFGRIYDIMGSQAVIIAGNEESAGKVYTIEEEQKIWLEKNHPEADEEKEDVINEETT
ncbi:MAG: C39 family peptidase [Ruminococcus sp.]|nr:C39 family peptidase [Ruminococcus sp.]